MATALQGLLDWVGRVLAALLTALDRDMKEVFIALVNPLVDLAVLLNPLPDYQVVNIVLLSPVR